MLIKCTALTRKFWFITSHVFRGICCL